MLSINSAVCSNVHSGEDGVGVGGGPGGSGGGSGPDDVGDEGFSRLETGTMSDNGNILNRHLILRKKLFCWW